jgi:hypothetical protein
MNDLELFEDVKIRRKWCDLQGLLKAWAPSPKHTDRPRRKLTWAASVVVSSVIGFNVAATALAPPGQATLVWPTPPTAAYTKQSLLESLQKIRTLGADWTGHSAASPVEKSVSAAQHILPQIPDVVADARAGVDGDGNVYLRLKQGDKVAYLTVEPKLLHLLYMEPGKDNIYIDDEQFKGKVLPARIKKVLKDNFVS